MSRILLLAGTGDARRIARDLSDLPIIASLAGATTAPAEYPCDLRTGGFGGAEAMALWIKANNIAAIIDATHPFAAQISANAVAAANATDTPITRILRPPWEQEPGETWIKVPTVGAAARALPEGARAFLATGRGSQDAFTARRDIWCALRLIDPPKSIYPGNGEYIVSRPPFDVASETALFSRLSISHLVVKNAGGAAARTKLTAAAKLNIPIIIVSRPEESNAASEIAQEDLREWLDRIGAN